MRYNSDVSYEEGELRPADSIEEKVSLSERFGLWLSFYPFSQDEYLAAAEYWVTALGGQWSDAAEQAALLWHRTRGARSGRVAWQFARAFVDVESRAAFRSVCATAVSPTKPCKNATNFSSCPSRSVVPLIVPCRWPGVDSENNIPSLTEP